MDMFVLRDEISAYIHCWTNSFLITNVDVVWGGVAASRIVKRNAMVRNHNHHCEFVAVFNDFLQLLFFAENYLTVHALSTVCPFSNKKNL